MKKIIDLFGLGIIFRGDDFYILFFGYRLV